MTIFDLTRPLSRVLAIPGQVVSETTCRNFRISARRPPSLRTLSCWALILSVSLLMVSGCGRYKEELESAKQQIEKLTSEVKRLSEEIARLNKEKISLSEESKGLSDKNARIQRELDQLNKSSAALSGENKELKKKAGLAEEEIASLKREKAQLAEEVEDLRKQLATRMAQAPEMAEATPIPSGQKTAKPLEEGSPCDAVLAFMKASEAIVRQQKGEQRTKSLKLVKRNTPPG